jgi:hypothetical protein
LALTSVLVHGDRIEFLLSSPRKPQPPAPSHYFLKLRNAKARSGIRYIPFHDRVRVLMPQHCVDATVRTYIDWLIGVFFTPTDIWRTEIDGLGSTKMRSFGHRISPPEVVPLTAGFRMTTDLRARKDRPVIDPPLSLDQTFVLFSPPLSRAKPRACFQHCG